MKKMVLKVISLTLALLMILTALAACDSKDDVIDAEEDRKAQTENKENDTPDDMGAFEFFEKADEVMDNMTSYRIDGTMTAKIYMPSYGMSLNASVNMLMIESGKGTDDYYALNEQSGVTTMTRGSDVSKTTLTSMDGFQNGKMFVMNDSDESYTDKAQKLYSTISAEDYIAHKKSMEEDGAIDTDISADTCKSANVSFDKDNKEWTAVYRSFTDVAKKEFDLGFSDMLENYDVSDVEVRIISDSSFVIKSIRMVYAFKYTGDGVEDKTQAPQMSVDMNCSGVNDTPKGKTVDFTGYTKVSDLRILDIADKALDKRIDAKSGAFKLECTWNGEYECYDYKYSHGTNGKLSYTAEYIIEGITYNVRYSDNKFRIDTSGNGRAEDSTDEEEYADIQDYIDWGEFDKSAVTDIQVVNAADGVYRFTIGNTDFAENYLVDNPDPTRSTQYFIFTIKNGALTEYRCEVNATSSIDGATGSCSIKCVYDN